MHDLTRGQVYPVLPLRDIVVFPHMIVPLFVGREKSVRALDDVMSDDKQILLVTQKNAAQDDPQPSDIYMMGTVATVLQLLKLPDGTVKVLVEGNQRARLEKFVDNPDFFQAEAALIEDDVENAQELEALSRAVVAEFEQYIKLNKKVPPEVRSRSTRSTSRASWPTRLRSTSRSRSPTSRRCSRSRRSASGWSASTRSWKARSA
jgi:ATP-dependent Lon protease